MSVPSQPWPDSSPQPWHGSIPQPWPGDVPLLPHAGPHPPALRTAGPADPGPFPVAVPAGPADPGPFPVASPAESAAVSESRSSWSSAPVMQPVAVPGYVSPAQEPGRSALAAVLSFFAVIVGIWAILAYVGEMTDVMNSIVEGNAKMIAQMESSNAGLAQMQKKTAYVGVMNRDATELRALMQGLDARMGTMLTDVTTIEREMSGMEQSIGELKSGLDAANGHSSRIGSQLGVITGGLQDEASKVSTMRRDVEAAARSLVALPPELRTTNARLGHINRNVSFMGRNGVSNSLRLRLTLLGIPNGSAEISGAIIPPGAWR